MEQSSQMAPSGEFGWLTVRHAGSSSNDSTHSPVAFNVRFSTAQKDGRANVHPVKRGIAKLPELSADWYRPHCP
jgi:hypothetical protein